MREFSAYIIERCEGFTVSIQEATVRNFKMRIVKPCNARFETHEPTGLCPSCGSPFEIQGPTIRLSIEETPDADARTFLTGAELADEHEKKIATACQTCAGGGRLASELLDLTIGAKMPSIYRCPDCAGTGRRAR